MTRTRRGGWIFSGSEFHTTMYWRWMSVAVNSKQRCTVMRCNDVLTDSMVSFKLSFKRWQRQAEADGYSVAVNSTQRCTVGGCLWQWIPHNDVLKVDVCGSELKTTIYCNAMHCAYVQCGVLTDSMVWFKLSFKRWQRQAEADGYSVAVNHTTMYCNAMYCVCIQYRLVYSQTAWRVFLSWTLRDKDVQRRMDVQWQWTAHHDVL